MYWDLAFYLKTSYAYDVTLLIFVPRLWLVRAWVRIFAGQLQLIIDPTRFPYSIVSRGDVIGKEFFWIESVRLLTSGRKTIDYANWIETYDATTYVDLGDCVLCQENSELFCGAVQWKYSTKNVCWTNSLAQSPDGNNLKEGTSGWSNSHFYVRHRQTNTITKDNNFTFPL